MAPIGSALNRTAAYDANEAAFLARLDELRAREKRVKLGGGQAALERLHQKGKLSARERIELLVDPGSDFLEVGLFAAWEMYEDAGGAPAAGTVLGVGTIHGRETVIVANDATVKAGA